MGKIGRPPLVCKNGRVCVKCGVNKPREDYSKDSRAASGIQTTCKDCHKAYFDQNAEHYKCLRKANPRYKERMKEYFIGHVDQINDYKRKRYASEEGKAKVKAISHKRRAQKKTTSDGTVTAEYILSLLQKQNYKCAISGKDIRGNYHVDHIIPLSKGGAHTAKNIQLLAPEVNLSKADRIYATN